MDDRAREVVKNWHDGYRYVARFNDHDECANDLAAAISAYGDEREAKWKVQVESLERALKMRDTFLAGDAAAAALQGVAAYLDIMFTGRGGRQMTADEMIEAIKRHGDEREREALERAATLVDQYHFSSPTYVANRVRSLIKTASEGKSND